MSISILRRLWLRNTLFLFFIVFFFILGIYAGQAWATPSDARISGVTHYYPKRVYVSTSQEQALKIERGTSTTTTTTTVPKPRPKPVSVQNVANNIPTPELQTQYPGSPQDWMREAGIPESDWPEAELLISREGGWRPCVHNGGIIDCNYSGQKAYGIPQSLPGSKMASEGTDWRTNPVTQLRWMKKYVEARYGTWVNANRMWESRRPYPWY